MRLPVCSVQKFVRIAPIALLSWTPMLALPLSSGVLVTPAAAQVESISVEFRTALEPYGSFRRVARWGEVWVPNVARDWRPYTVGRWVYSDDYGWYWASDEAESSWGWVAFHYGRWVWVENIGWAWVPGREWGPAWVDWRRGDRYVGWAPLPPDEVVVEIRDEPQYWVFCRPNDFLVTNVSTVFIEPEPVLLRETVVVNETVVIHDRGFAVNPGIEPTFIAASIGRPVPEFEVRPHVLAGTAAVPNAIEVRAEDLRRTDFRQNLVRQSNITETNNTIRPTANVPQPQPLAPNEHGRLGENPPRAASAFSQQPGSIGRAPEQRETGERGTSERGINEQGATGEQRDLRERGATGPAEQQERGLRERGATGPAEQQERGVRERGATGPAEQQERGLRQRGATGPAEHQERGLREPGATGPAEQQERGLRERGATGKPEQQRTPSGRGANSGQERGLYNRGETGLSPGTQRGQTERGTRVPTPEQQRGPGERGATGTTPEQQRGLPQRGSNRFGTGQERPLYNRGETEQRGLRQGGQPDQQRTLRDRGANNPAIEQQRRMPPASREHGAAGPSPSQERQLFNRAPAPGQGPQRGAGERGPSGPGPGSGGQRRSFDQGR
jgi:hypothetical protein